MITRIERTRDPERPLRARPQPASAIQPTIARDTVLVGKSPAKLTQAGVAALVGSGVFITGAELVKLKKGIEDVRKLRAKMDKARLTGADRLRDRFQEGVKAYNAHQKAPENALKSLSKLDKLDNGIRVLSGVSAGFEIKDSFKALADGATTVEVATLAGDALSILRGSDAMLKLVKNAKLGLIPLKMAPGVSAAAGLADAVKRWDKLSTGYEKLTPTDRFAHTSFLVSDVADMLGVIPAAYPFTKLVAGGFALVGLAAENWDRFR